MNIITDMILALRQQHGAIQVSAYRDFVKDALTKVAQHDYDLAFITFNEAGAMDIYNDINRYQLEFHPIFSDKLSICTREGHPLQSLGSVRLADVTNYERVTLSPQKDLFLMRKFGMAETQQPTMRINDVLNTRKYAAETDAVLITPKSEVIRSNRDYRYKLVPLEMADFDVEVIGGWVHHGNHHMTTAEKCVVETLEKVCQAYTLQDE